MIVPQSLQLQLSEITYIIINNDSLLTERCMAGKWSFENTILIAVCRRPCKSKQLGFIMPYHLTIHCWKRLVQTLACLCGIMHLCKQKTQGYKRKRKCYGETKDKLWKKHTVFLRFSNRLIPALTDLGFFHRKDKRTLHSKTT